MSTTTKATFPSIFDLIQSSQWDKVTERIQTNPTDAYRSDSIGLLPLHCLAECNDMRIIQSILAANPKAAKNNDNAFKRIPLHFFAACDSPDDALRELIKIFPMGLIARDSKGCHPHKLASSDRVKLLLEIEREQLKIERKQKRVPDNEFCTSSSLINKRKRMFDDIPTKTDNKSCPKLSIPTNRIEPLVKLIERIKDRESFLGVCSTTAQSLLERMSVLDRLFWGEQQMGGIIERLHKLFFVDEGKSMTWNFWIEYLENQIEGNSLVSLECHDDIQVRIGRMESHIFGEVKVGSLGRRLRALGDADI